MVDPVEGVKTILDLFLEVLRGILEIVRLMRAFAGV
jgi:hypothetical protein